MKANALRIALLFSFGSILMACSSGTPPEVEPVAERPAEWAASMGEVQGLSNFYKVSDQLYRGAQPEEEGFAELKKLGIKTVVNLRTFHTDRDECEDAGLRYVHITVQAWEGEDDEVIDFLKVALDPGSQPVFVHCQHGADRTGVMSAVYRIAVEGWSKEEAINEMIEGGFGFHSVWKNLVEYVEEIDITHIQELSGIDSRNAGDENKA